MQASSFGSWRTCVKLLVACRRWYLRSQMSEFSTKMIPFSILDRVFRSDVWKFSSQAWPFLLFLKLLCQMGDAAYSQGRECKSSTKRSKYCGWRSRQLNWLKSPSAKYIHIKAMITQRELYKNRPWAACSHTTSGTHRRTALDCCYLILVVSDIRRL